ncbi:1677_t:CDS:1, partial [Scutellospora calospora]
TNQENAIAPENLIDFILNNLLDDYDFDDYLFEKVFCIALELLIDIVDSISEDHINKDIVQQIINLISKANKFSWIYYKYQVTKKSCAFVYYCNCCEELKSKKL